MPDQDSDEPTTVSFAAAAAETPEESVDHERDALEAAGLDEPGDDDAAPVLQEAGAEENTAPAQPELSSMLGIGPVTPGDDTVA